MNNTDWNPELYLKFSNERTQPSIDLVNKIPLSDPGSIIDIGCGPGNSTQVLHKRWPDAEVTGADNSPAMISRAKEDYPELRWIILDAGTERLEEKFDLVFSNATIQWIPNHRELIGRFFELLNVEGVLAVQLPAFFHMPLGMSLDEIAQNPQWISQTRGVREQFTIHEPDYYYSVLSGFSSHINLWVTDYFHEMDSPEAILEMIRTTGLKPYLDRLSTLTEQQEFEMEVLSKIVQDYPIQHNGKVLFPFKRIFFTAKKTG